MSRRLGNIDGLRGLSALLVLTQHLLEHVGQYAPIPMQSVADPSGFLLRYCDLGKVGVVAFFAISGFVVPFSFRGAAPRAGFIISRMFRLYPAYWLSLIAAALILPAIGRHAFTAPQLLANLTLVQFLFRQPDVLPVYWTLLIEIFFYSFCFVLFLVGVLRSARWLFAAFCACLLAAAASGILRTYGHAAPPTALPLYLAVMWFGTSVRRATRDGDKQARRYCRLMLPLLILAVPLVWSVAYTDGSHKESVLADITAFYLAFALFLLCVLKNRFTSAWLVQCGALSYSLYLFHPIALDIGDFLAGRLPLPVGAAVLVAVTVVGSFLAAQMVHSRVERPMISLGQRVVAMLARPVLLNQPTP